MPVVGCPIEGCEYETPDVDAVVAAALITTHATVHKSASPDAATARVEKVKRPNISSAGATEDWQYFKSRWNDYVRATKLTGTDKVIQLLECCDDQLRKDLTRTANGTLAEKTEDEVLTAMRSLAVREENTMVARVTLQNMRQDRDEPIRAYGARLRGQANVCRFMTKCSNCDADVDYTETILRDVLSRGLSDPEIQLDLLGDKNQDMTLEQVVRFVEAKEAGKHAPLDPARYRRTHEQCIQAPQEGSTERTPTKGPRNVYILRKNRTWKKRSGPRTKERMPRLWHDLQPL